MARSPLDWLVAVVTLTALRTQPSYTVTASCNALPGLVAATSAPSQDVVVTGQTIDISATSCP